MRDKQPIGVAYIGKNTQQGRPLPSLLGILCLCRVLDILFKVLPSGKKLPTIGT